MYIPVYVKQYHSRQQIGCHCLFDIARRLVVFRGRPEKYAIQNVVFDRLYYSLVFVYVDAH